MTFLCFSKCFSSSLPFSDPSKVEDGGEGENEEIFEEKYIAEKILNPEK